MKTKNKRTRLEKREGIQAALEGWRRFDYDYIPFGTYTVPMRSSSIDREGLMLSLQGLFAELCG